MKVLHTEWSDGWGGQEIRIIGEMKAMRALGVELALACSPEAKINAAAREAGFEVFELPFRGSFDLATFFGLIRIIKRFKFDIVNTHSGKDTWVGGLAAKCAGAKFIRTRHLSSRINPSRLNFINSLADFVVTTGESVRADMIKFNRIDPAKIRSIPTGADESVFDPARYDREKCREEFKFESGTLVVGALAVLRGLKRHDIFLKIALALHERYPKARFVIAGEGPMRPSLEKFIAENGMEGYARLIGHVSEPAKFLAAIDIFALTSEKEGVPQSVMQALLMGVPTVASDVGSVSDLFDGSNFELAKFGEESLQAAIESLLSDPTRLAALRANEQRLIRENFTQKVMAQKTLEIYQKLVQI